MTSRAPVALDGRHHFSCRTPLEVIEESVPVSSHPEGSVVPSVHIFALSELPCTRNRTHCFAVVTEAAPATVANCVVVPALDFHSCTVPSSFLNCKKYEVPG